MTDWTDWTDAMKSRLRELWDEGLSARLIGERLGASKNAVLAKARRLKLPPRPTVIQHGGELKVCRPHKHKRKQPRKPSFPAAGAQCATGPVIRHSPAVVQPRPLAIAPVAAIIRFMPKGEREVEGCRYQLGPEGHRTPCGKPRIIFPFGDGLLEKPYCELHYAVCTTQSDGRMPQDQLERVAEHRRGQQRSEAA